MRIRDWSSDVCSSDLAAVATLAALGGGWAVHANQYGRYIAMVVLAFLGLTLLSTRLAEWISRPFVALGNRLSQRSASDSDSIWGAAGLGVATGLLWAPCAGPILGLLLTGAALNGASVRSEEHTSELQSLMRNSYAVFCLKKKKIDKNIEQ